MELIMSKRMNYLLELKAFYNFIDTTLLSTGQIALYHALLHMNNKCGWMEWFTVANTKLQSMTGLGENGVYNASIALEEKGAISVIRKDNFAASYKINSLVIDYCNSFDNDENGWQSGRQSSPLINKTNQNNTKQYSTKQNSTTYAAHHSKEEKKQSYDIEEFARLAMNRKLTYRDKTNETSEKEDNNGDCCKLSVL